MITTGSWISKSNRCNISLALITSRADCLLRSDSDEPSRDPSIINKSKIGICLVLSCYWVMTSQSLLLSAVLYSVLRLTSKTRLRATLFALLVSQPSLVSLPSLSTSLRLANNRSNKNKTFESRTKYCRSSCPVLRILDSLIFLAILRKHRIH